MEVEALGSSVLVASNMLVMSAYSNSELVEVPAEFVEEEEEDGFDSYTVSGSEESDDKL